MKDIIRNNIFRIAALLTIIVVFFIYRSYSDKYKLTFELEVDYKIFLSNSSVYQDSFFKEKLKHSSQNVDRFFNEFKKSNIPLNKYYKGENDEDIIRSIKHDLSEKSDKCFEKINEMITTHQIDARVEKLKNGNFQIKFDMTEDWDRILKLFTSSGMPLPLKKVNKVVL